MTTGAEEMASVSYFYANMNLDPQLKGYCTLVIPALGEGRYGDLLANQSIPDG